MVFCFFSAWSTKHQNKRKLRLTDECCRIKNSANLSLKEQNFLFDMTYDGINFAKICQSKWIFLFFSEFLKYEDMAV